MDRLTESRRSRVDRCIQGKVSARKVVEALMSAEQALQMAVAVRDKVVQAYQEVSDADLR